MNFLLYIIPYIFGTHNRPVLYHCYFHALNANKHNTIAWVTAIADGLTKGCRHSSRLPVSVKFCIFCRITSLIACSLFLLHHPTGSGLLMSCGKFSGYLWTDTMVRISVLEYEINVSATTNMEPCCLFSIQLLVLLLMFCFCDLRTRRPLTPSAIHFTCVAFLVIYLIQEKFHCPIMECDGERIEMPLNILSVSLCATVHLAYCFVVGRISLAEPTCRSDNSSYGNDLYRINPSPLSLNCLLHNRASLFR